MRFVSVACSSVLCLSVACGGVVDPDPPGGGAGGSDSTHGGAAGAAGSVGGSASEPGRSAVHGRIRASLEDPAPLIAVIIDNEVTATDEDGEFSFADVPETYDLTLIDQPNRYVRIFRGMTTRSPDLRFLGGGQYRSGWIQGRLSGGVGVPLPEGVTTQVGLISQRQRFGGWYGSPGESAYAFTVGWFGRPTLTTDLWALQYTADEAGPLHYTGFAFQPGLTFQNGTELGSLEGDNGATDLTLAPVAERSYTAAISGVEGAYLVGSSINMEGIVTPVRLSAGDNRVTVPELGRETFLRLSAYFFDGSGSVTAPLRQSPSVELAVPARVELLEPAESVEWLSTTQEFSWVAPPAARVSVVNWTINGWQISELTGESHTRLPDLSSLGVYWIGDNPSGSWSVAAVTPSASTEEAARVLEDDNHIYYEVPTSISHSETRDFLLSP
ncbi:MAG: hypothetical protein K0R38_585 [Polyangiaceae bacterium]|jgi:hypothetical protein|nr:hypothetical protein [Polyangiaceae bacterium]